jgi:hypothetical protein
MPCAAFLASAARFFLLTVNQELHRSRKLDICVENPFFYLGFRFEHTSIGGLIMYIGFS